MRIFSHFQSFVVIMLSELSRKIFVLRAWDEKVGRKAQVDHLEVMDESDQYFYRPSGLVTAVLLNERGELYPRDVAELHLDFGPITDAQYEVRGNPQAIYCVGRG